MAIYQPTNITPSTLSGLNKSTVDVTEDLSISWQVNGNSPMTGFYIEFTDVDGNNTGLTPIAEMSLQTPFYGTDSKGNPKFYNYTPSATWASKGLQNGNDYRLKITQFWQGSVYVYTRTGSSLSTGEYYFHIGNKYVFFRIAQRLEVDGKIIYDPISDTVGEYNSSAFYELNHSVHSTAPATGTSLTAIQGTDNRFVRQYSESAFLTRTTPTVTINPISNNGWKLSTTFTASYTQEQGDEIASVQWILTNDLTGKVVRDTGKIMTGELAFTYNNLFADLYTLKLIVITENGVTANTTYQFNPIFQLPGINTNAPTTEHRSDGSTLFYANDSVQNKTEFTRTDSKGNIVILGVYNLPYIKDFSAKSQEIYTYGKREINTQGGREFPALSVMSSEATCIHNTKYLLIEATPDSVYDHIYHALNTWQFGTNLEASEISNNNTPNWLETFTGYRAKQSSSLHGKTGTLSALLKNVNKYNKYYDTAEEMEKLYQASLSDNDFFLRDCKGNFYKVAISSPISQTIDNETSVREVRISLPWEEVGSADGIAVIQTPDDPNWTLDEDTILSPLDSKINDTISSMIGDILNGRY